jgi:hypothetical protein
MVNGPLKEASRPKNFAKPAPGNTWLPLADGMSQG